MHLNNRTCRLQNNPNPVENGRNACTCSKISTYTRACWFPSFGHLSGDSYLVAASIRSKSVSCSPKERPLHYYSMLAVTCNPSAMYTSEVGVGTDTRVSYTATKPSTSLCHSAKATSSCAACSTASACSMPALYDQA